MNLRLLFIHEVKKATVRLVTLVFMSIGQLFSSGFGFKLVRFRAACLNVFCVVNRVQFRVTFFFRENESLCNAPELTFCFRSRGAGYLTTHCSGQNCGYGRLNESVWIIKFIQASSPSLCEK